MLGLSIPSPISLLLSMAIKFALSNELFAKVIQFEAEYIIPACINQATSPATAGTYVPNSILID